MKRALTRARKASEDLRARYRWTVAELAKRSGVSVEQLERIEAAADPDIALGVDPQQLVMRRTDPTQ